MFFASNVDCPTFGTPLTAALEPEAWETPPYASKRLMGPPKLRPREKNPQREHAHGNCTAAAEGGATRHKLTVRGTTTATAIGGNPRHEHARGASVDAAKGKRRVTSATLVMPPWLRPRAKALCVHRLALLLRWRPPDLCRIRVSRPSLDHCRRRWGVYLTAQTHFCQPCRRG